MLICSPRKVLVCLFLHVAVCVQGWLARADQLMREVRQNYGHKQGWSRNPLYTLAVTNSRNFVTVWPSERRAVKLMAERVAGLRLMLAVRVEE